MSKAASKRSCRAKAAEEEARALFEAAAAEPSPSPSPSPSHPPPLEVEAEAVPAATPEPSPSPSHPPPLEVEAEAVPAATPEPSPSPSPSPTLPLEVKAEAAPSDGPCSSADPPTKQEIEEPPQKRQKVEAPAAPAAKPLLPPPPQPRPLEFRCKFSQIVAFKSFFENLGSVLHEVTLQVHCDPNGFSGIVADSMDPRGVALVHGRLTGQVELNVPKEQATFCITVKDVLDLFFNVHPNHFVDIYRLQASTDISVYIYEPSIRTTTPKFQIRTLAKPLDTISLEDMKFSYYVEIELTTFRNALKTAKSQKAIYIQLCVYEIPRTRPGEKTIFFVVKYTSERSTAAIPYQSTIVTQAAQEGPVTIRALDGGGDASEEEDGAAMLERLEAMLPAYQGTFQAEYLYLFVKSMDRFNITLRLGHGGPLIVDYPLGCSATDSLRYVLAPTIQE